MTPDRDARAGGDIDPQVIAAANKMTDEQRRAPEWVWCDGERAGYGRWPVNPTQAPYIRADIALAEIERLRLERTLRCFICRDEEYAAEIERLREALREATAGRDALIQALTPRCWTQAQSHAWHRHIPDVDRAFLTLLAETCTAAIHTEDALAAAGVPLSAMPEPAGWQPIATAPRDGGFLCSDGKTVWAAWHYNTDNWHSRYGSRGATHWCALPAPPEVTK